MGWIDSSLGGQVVALQLKSERAELIAGNIANSDRAGKIPAIAWLSAPLRGALCKPLIPNSLNLL